MAYEFNPNDVRDFANTISAETKEKGNELFFKYCPYCHGNGSNKRDKETFSINLLNGTFKCFRASCGKQGHFVELCRDFGYTLDFGEVRQYRQLHQPKEITIRDSAIEYLNSRGISKQTAEKYKITSMKSNSSVLVFPFYDENNVLTFIKYRNTNYNGTGNKEWCEKDTKPILFGMAQCTDFDTLIITEGQIDSLSIAECGINNAVSVPTGAMGFTWLTNVWEWINKFKTVIVFGDWEKGKMTLLDTLKKRLSCKILAVRQEDYLGEKDANDILRKYGAKAIKTAIQNAEAPKLANVQELSNVESIDINNLPMIKTNIPEVDRIIGGLIMGQVVLLSGKRGNGKSTFMSQLIADALDQGETVFVYSGELANYHFKRWLDYQLAGKERLQEHKNKFGDIVYSLSDIIIKRINTWYKGRAYIYDSGYIPEEDKECETLIETIEKVIRQYDARLICIDNLMTAMDREEGTDLYRAQSKFVGELKKLAVRHNVAVILVAHPRKSNSGFENDDVSGTADITNKADVVMSYSRDDVIDGYDGKLLITKNRLFGKYAVGDNAINLYYSPATKRITSEQSQTCKKYGWETMWDEEIDAMVDRF